MTCITGGSQDISKNGTTRRGKQNYRCLDNLRNLIEHPQWNPKDKETLDRVNLLFLLKNSFAGISLVTEVSENWLQGYFKESYTKVSRIVFVVPKAKGKLTVQLDELLSFIDDIGYKQWVCLVIDSDTPEIIGCYVGDRSRISALQLWPLLPDIYRQCAKVYTDYFEAYITVILRKRYCAVGRKSGLTSYIERLNNTMQQRGSRLVRKTLSFSKKSDNHIGAIRTFIHEYNCLVRERLIEAVHPAIASVLYKKELS